MEAEFSRLRLLLGVDLTAVLGLELDRWRVAQSTVQTGFVEPVHPAQGGEFEVLEATPGAFAVGAFGLVEPMVDSAIALS